MTQAPQTPRAPDLERHTLTPLGYAVAILVPVLIAVVGLTMLHFNYDSDDVVEGERVPILTSNFIPGQANAGALIAGEVTLDDEGCVRLVGQDGTVVTPVWPADYEASLYRDELRIYDADRTIVARGGNRVQMGGEFEDVGAFAASPCAPESGQVAVVQTEVAVTG